MLERPGLAETMQNLEAQISALESNPSPKMAALKAHLAEIRDQANAIVQLHSERAQAIKAKADEVTARSKAVVERAKAASEAAGKAKKKARAVFPPPKKKELPGQIDPALGDKLRDQLLKRFGHSNGNGSNGGLDWTDWLAGPDGPKS